MAIVFPDYDMLNATCRLYSTIGPRESHGVRYEAIYTWQKRIENQFYGWMCELENNMEMFWERYL